MKNNKNNKVWIGTDQLSNDPAFIESQRSEFTALPLVDQLADEDTIKLEATRRDFLKYLGFGIGAAAVAAGCDIPVRKAVPYVVQPDKIVPGIATYYASTFVQGGDYCPVLVKTREGRPIKIEGNSISPITRGGTSARAQASVLSLYDTSRFAGPYRIADDGVAQVPTSRWTAGPSWEEIDKEITAKLNPNSRIRIVSHTILSPTTKQAIADFRARFPNTTLVIYDPVSSAALLRANEQDFGQRAIPSYHFDRADLIVGIECDFLGTWISPIEYAAQYVQGRRIRDTSKPTKSRHIQIESYMSLTGSNADNRVPVKPSEIGAAIVALYNEIAGGGGNAQLPAEKLAKVRQVAEQLKAARGRSLVVSGSNNLAEQQLVNAINQALGNYGNTLDFNRPSMQRQGSDQDLRQLVSEMNAGQVDALFVMDGANPAFDNPSAAQFRQGMAKVGLKVSFSGVPNETLALCNYVAPTHHYLESWSDVEAKSGSYTLIQPTIMPIFASIGKAGTRQAEESLLRWAQSDRLDTTVEQPYLAYLMRNWQEKIFPRQNRFSVFQAFWDSTLHDGVLELPAGQSPTASLALGYGAARPSAPAQPTAPATATDTTAAVTTTTPDTTAAAAPVAAQPRPSTSAAGAVGRVRRPSGSEMEITFYETVNMGGGQYAANPWLLELPDPVTRTTWGNYLSIPVRWEGGNEWLGFKNLNPEEYKGKADIVNLAINGVEQPATCVRQFGQPEGTVAIALGYGREKTGKIDQALGQIVGINVFPWLSYDQDGFVQYYAGSVEISDRVGIDDEFPNVQYHHTMGVTTKEDGKVLVDEDTGKPFNIDEKTIMAVGSGFQGGLVNRSVIFQGQLSELGELTEHIAEFRAEAQHLNEQTLYPFDKYDALLYSQGHHWAMHIDLNACIGCGACEVACVAENNVPVVGKREVSRHHEMKWLRIDRYYYGDYENPRTVYQPMLCQHCDNAPCENVCPVAATTHNAEGINQMIYNRCIGTRYCANNCPYKVRRFNWLDYTTADLFAANEPELMEEELPFGADNLTRMVLNPDVTVRSRGVMEKCTFCVQRIQQGKLTAKVEGRQLRENDVRTACQMACPTGAIVFGDRNNQNSEVAELIKHPLNYLVLEEVNTQSSVFYAARVANSSEELEA